MTAAAHEPARRRRGRPAKAAVMTSPPVVTAPTAATPTRFPMPTRHGLAAVLEHVVCESLNQSGFPTDTAGWLLLPGQSAETLFGRAVAHLDAALVAQDCGAGYWRSDIELADDDGPRGRFRLLIGDTWITTTQAVTFRHRSVDFQGGTVHLAARNAGRRIVRLLAEAAASALVKPRAESIH